MDFETVPGAASPLSRRTAHVDREAAIFRATGPVSAMSLRSSRTLVSGSVDNGALPGFHGRSSVALIGADSAWMHGGRRQARHAGLPFQLAEDGLLVLEKVANEPIAMAFVHGQTALEAGAEYAWGQNLGQRSRVGLVG